MSWRPGWWLWRKKIEDFGLEIPSKFKIIKCSLKVLEISLNGFWGWFSSIWNSVIKKKLRFIKPPYQILHVINSQILVGPCFMEPSHPRLLCRSSGIETVPANKLKQILSTSRSQVMLMNGVARLNEKHKSQRIDCTTSTQNILE
jgi:hypothetical protein